MSKFSNVNLRIKPLKVLVRRGKPSHSLTKPQFTYPRLRHPRRCALLQRSQRVGLEQKTVTEQANLLRSTRDRNGAITGCKLYGVDR